MKAPKVRKTKWVLNTEKVGSYWYVSGNDIPFERDVNSAFECAVERLQSKLGIPLYSKVKLIVTTYKPHRYDVKFVDTAKGESGWAEYEANGFGMVDACNAGLKATLGWRPEVLYVRMVAAE